MAKKIDGVVNAAHFDEDGNVRWVRMYQRRGLVYTDQVIVPRKALIEQLEQGKQIVSGERIPRMGNVFDIDDDSRFHLVTKNGKVIITSGDAGNFHDQLGGIPVI